MSHSFPQGHLEKKIKERIEFFYNRGSVLPSNKFYVGLWGQYLLEAIVRMKRDVSLGNSSFEHTNNAKAQVNQFEDTYVINNGEELDFQWTVNSITVPTVQAETKNVNAIDTIKNISFPLIANHEGTGLIKLDIVEDRQMGLYQFFNALTNTFFNSAAMKARNSFHKLGLYVIVINGDFIEEGIESFHPHEVPLQIFQFESIAFKGITNLRFEQKLEADIVKYTVTFEAPNLFQLSYQNFGSFTGLQDNTGDIQNFATDASGVGGNGSYNKNKFELDASELSSIGNTLEKDRFDEAVGLLNDPKS